MRFIKTVYKKLKQKIFYNRCFSKQEWDGIAAFGMCCGPQNPEFVVLGKYACCDCPYYTPISK